MRIYFVYPVVNDRRYLSIILRKQLVKMTRSNALIVLVYLTLFICCAYGSLSIECFPNKTIIMENPEPDYFTHCVANDSVRVCGVTFSANNTYMYINDCNLNDRILVSLTNRTSLDTILGGFGSVLYVIQCNSVGESGVNRTVFQTLLPSVPVTSATPDVVIYAETVFREHNTSGQEITSASVGQRITWTMECAEEHFLRILNCTAFGGQSTTSSDSVVLILDGCTQDTSLVSSNFANDDFDVISGEKRYYADFHVFKFYDHDYVTISCTVRVCPPNDNVCSMPGCDRRKRYIEPFKPTMSDASYQAARATLRIVETLSVASKPNIGYGVLVLLAVGICSFSQKNLLD